MEVREWSDIVVYYCVDMHHTRAVKMSFECTGIGVNNCANIFPASLRGTNFILGSFLLH